MIHLVPFGGLINGVFQVSITSTQNDNNDILGGNTNNNNNNK